MRTGNYDAAGNVQQPCPGTMLVMIRAEVAELVDALDSKSSGARPRAGSIPAFGIGLRSVRLPRLLTDKTTNQRRS